MSIQEELEFCEVSVPPVLAVQVPGRSGSDPASISAGIGAAFGTLAEFIGRHGLTPAGPPRAIYTAYGPEGVSFTVVMPVAAGTTAAAEPPVEVGSLAGGRAYRFTHRGPYRDLMQTYGRITAFLKATGRMESEADWARYMPMWEEYQNDPEKIPEVDLLTYIYLPAG